MSGMDILSRLAVDSGRLTLGQLLQEREAARLEIERLRGVLERLQEKAAAKATPPPQASAKGSRADGAYLMRIDELCEQIGVSRGTIYRWMAEGEFPTSVKLSRHCVRWRSEDVEQWRTALENSRR